MSEICEIANDTARRHNPQSKEEAYAYEIHEQVKMLLRFALYPKKKAFYNQVEIVRATISLLDKGEKE